MCTFSPAVLCLCAALVFNVLHPIASFQLAPFSCQMTRSLSVAFWVAHPAPFNSGDSDASPFGGCSKDKHFSTSKLSGSADGKGNDGGHGLSCPKCGDPCTHVETFVCMFILYHVM